MITIAFVRTARGMRTSDIKQSSRSSARRSSSSWRNGAFLRCGPVRGPSSLVQVHAPLRSLERPAEFKRLITSLGASGPSSSSPKAHTILFIVSSELATTCACALVRKRILRPSSISSTISCMCLALRFSIFMSSSLAWILSFEASFLNSSHSFSSSKPPGPASMPSWTNTFFLSANIISLCSALQVLSSSVSTSSSESRDLARSGSLRIHFLPRPSKSTQAAPSL